MHAIIDDAVSSVALANIPIITKNKISMISTGSTNPDLSGSSPYFFRLWNSDIEESVIGGRFIASELGYEKGVILYIRNEYGDGLQKGFEKEFAKYGGIILGKESFEPGASRFREQLFKLKALNPQFVYVIGYPAEIPRILIEMKKLSFNKKVITTAAIQDKSVVEQAKKAAEGVIYPYAKPAQTKITEAFKKAYKQKYGEDPGSPADVISPQRIKTTLLHPFLPLDIDMQALEIIKDDPGEVKKYLWGDKDRDIEGMFESHEGNEHYRQKLYDLWHLLGKQDYLRQIGKKASSKVERFTPIDNSSPLLQKLAGLDDDPKESPLYNFVESLDTRKKDDMDVTAEDLCKPFNLEIEVNGKKEEIKSFHNWYCALASCLRGAEGCEGK